MDNSEVAPEDGAVKKRRSIGSIILWAIVFFIVVIGLVQYLNAAKYDVLVQVIQEDKIGVNPTGEKLDFGDLPHNKSAIRKVTLVSGGNTPSYIIIWKLGEISDLIKSDKNFFTLEPHATQSLEFTAYIPNSAEFRYYKGTVIIFQIPKLW